MLRLIPTLFSSLFLMTLTGCAGAENKTADTSRQAQVYKPVWQTIKPAGDTICSDGSPYSFHVKSGDPDKLFIFFNGGGACWDAKTCNISEDRQTYVPRADLDHNHPDNHGGIFDLNNPKNPVKEWTMVFASYCTGDVHIGSTVRKYTKPNGIDFNIHHKGAVNAQAVLNWVAENLRPDVAVVSGASAGAVASPIYAGHIAERFPQAKIVQFADGAAGYRSPASPILLKQWNAFSQLSDARYKTLDTENASFYDFYKFESQANPRLHFSMFDTAEDAVQIMFRQLTGDKGTLLAAVGVTYDDVTDDTQNFTSYLAQGTDHTILRFDRFYTTSVKNELFSTWFGRLIDGQKPDRVDCRTLKAGCVSTTP